jgi:two-component system LytT family sensor kinase
MKRLSLHIIFWVIYLLQDILLQYTWNMKDTSLDHQFWRAVGTALVVLPAKLIIVYFFIYRILPKWGNTRTNLFWFITEATIVFTAGLLLFRLLGIYVVAPFMYNNHAPQDWGPSN